jgi:hypothetical protein
MNLTYHNISWMLCGMCLLIAVVTGALRHWLVSEKCAEG